MTHPPPRAIRVAALAREIAPLLTDPGDAPGIARALDALVVAAVDPEAAALPPPPRTDVPLHDLARDHALLFAPLLRPALDPAALALAASLGPAVGWSRFREPRAITPEEAAAWRRLEAAFAPVGAALAPLSQGERGRG